MKDKNGIKVCCENCSFYNGKFCEIKEQYPECNKKTYFAPTIATYEARIGELSKLVSTLEQKLYDKEQDHIFELSIQNKCIADLQNKMAATAKLFVERLRECGRLQALLEVKSKLKAKTLYWQPLEGTEYPTICTEIETHGAWFNLTLEIEERERGTHKYWLKSGTSLIKQCKSRQEAMETAQDWLDAIINAAVENMSPQSTDAADVSKNGENSTESEEK